MTKPRVFVTRPLGASVIDFLGKHAEVSCYPVDEPISVEALTEACREVEGLMPAGVRVSAEVLAAATHLRAISNVAVGCDNIDLAVCTARGIPVTNTAGSLEETTADLAFALLLAIARRIPEGDRYVREGRWKHWQWSVLWGSNVHGKTLGILGFGHIGQALARRGKGFSMRLLYHSRRRVAEAIETETQATYVDRATLLRESDFLSLHVPSAPETHHLIDAEAFGRMKRSAFLVNASRGQIVDEAALIAALESGRIAGAALDVFEQEPAVPARLIALSNVVMTPHVGSGTAETRLAMAMLAAHNLVAMLNGQRPENVVNPKAFDETLG